MPASASLRRAALCCALLAVVSAQSGAANIGCNAEFYGSAYDFEKSVAGLLPIQEACRTAIQSLTFQQFGPATAFETMNMMCKGPCRIYYDHYTRLAKIASDTGCKCEDTQNRCPVTRTDYLCHFTGFCYDDAFYEDKVCAPDACGRWITNERQYRAQRRACGQSLDGASSAVVGSLAAIAVMVVGWRLARAGGAGHEEADEE